MTAINKIIRMNKKRGVWRGAKVSTLLTLDSEVS